MDDQQHPSPSLKLHVRFPPNIAFPLSDPDFLKSCNLAEKTPRRASRRGRRPFSGPLVFSTGFPSSIWGAPSFRRGESGHLRIRRLRGARAGLGGPPRCSLHSCVNRCYRRDVGLRPASDLSQSSCGRKRVARPTSFGARGLGVDRAIFSIHTGENARDNKCLGRVRFPGVVHLVSSFP